MAIWGSNEASTQQHKTLLVISDNSSNTPQALIAKLRQGGKNVTGKTSAGFHLSYSFIRYADDDTNLNIYTSDGTHTPSLVKPDLTLQVLDYREPHSWLRKLSALEGPVIALVTNRGSAEMMDQDTHEFLQLATRSVCLSKGFSLIYADDMEPVASIIAQILVIKSRAKGRPLQGPREFYIEAGTDSWNKIAALTGSLTANDLRDAVEGGLEGFILEYEEKTAQTAKKPQQHRVTEPLPKPMTYTEFLRSLS